MMAHRALHVVTLIATMLAHGSTAAPVRHAPRAQRICRPAPPAPNNTKVCLVIGDSVSLGVTGAAFGAGPCDARGCCSGGCLAIDMVKDCEVLHAPFSGDGGACDVRYGVECASVWLGSNLAGGSAPKYSAITFNFGLHDTNDSGEDEESRDEFVPLEDYGKGLLAFVKLVRKYQPQARLAWLSSTPMHFDMHLNDNVNKYNVLAHKLLVAPTPSLVDGFVDLNAVVTGACGQPPYFGSKLYPNATTHCDLIDDNEEYHYNSKGWKVLASEYAAELRRLLNKGQRPTPLQTLVDPWIRTTAVPASPGASMCPVDARCVQKAGVQRCTTGCIIGSSCVADTFADSGWGCCMVGDGATSCNDGFHCCAKGTRCVANGTNPISANKPNPLNYSHVCVPEAELI